MRVGDLAFDLAMSPLESRVLGLRRKRFLACAAGRVLEIGAGTGVNLPYYEKEAIDSLVVSDFDPRPVLAERCSRAGLAPPTKADVVSLPFPSSTFDTVVGTLLFCSVEDPRSGFAEMRRVLRKGGVYLFIEHVLSPEHALAGLQHRLSPAWRRLAGGCRLNRDTLSTIADSGFELVAVERFLHGAVVAGAAISR